MENTSFLTEIIYIFFGLLNYFIDFVIICLELRYCISWFLNINPYFEPFLSLWAFTSPIMWFGKSFYPRIFGVQIAPMINYRALKFVQENLDTIIKTIKSARLESSYLYKEDLNTVSLSDVNIIIASLLEINEKIN